MPATGKITLDASDYKKTLEEVKTKTVTASNDMSKAVKKFGGDVGGAGKAVSALSSEVGSSFGQIGRVIGAVASGPVAILAAAFGALMAAGVKLWDELTISSEEYQAKLEKQVEMEEKRLAKLREQQSEEDSYMERLKELSTQESLSNAEKEEAAFLLETLSKRYKDFSAEIDEATGKITGLTEAEMKLNELQKQQKIKQLETVTQTNSKRIEKEYENIITPGFWGKLGNAFSFNGVNYGWEVDKFRSMGFSNINDQRNFVYSKFNGATTKEEQDQWYGLLQLIDKQIEDLEKLKSLRKTDEETVKEHAETMKKASETERKEIDSQAAAWKSYNDARVKAEQDAERRAEEAARRDLEALKREQNARAKEQQSFRSMALKAVGLGSRAAREEAVLAAEMRVGGPLNEDQYRKAVNFANAKFRLENFQFNAPQDFAPRVNSLVARGGSDAPVSMPKIEDLQAQTLNNVKTIKDLAARFLSAAEDWGTF